MGRNTQWFVEPLDQHTNEVVVAEVSIKDTFEKITCSDRKPHNLYLVPSSSITFLNRSKLTNHFLEFRVWVKEGGGQIRPWNLQDRKMRRRQRMQKAINTAVASRKKSSLKEHSRSHP